MVFRALSDLYIGSVNYANRNILRTLAKQAVFGHLLKAAIESAFLSLHFYRADYVTPIFLLSVHPIS